MSTDAFPTAPAQEGYIGRIPLRNIWFLMLYASDLTRVLGRFDACLEDDLTDLPDLVARLLATAVERRLRRNLTRGYRHREMVLSRVRGRIDVLTTETRQLLSKGQIFCRFEDLTIDMPRNRLVLAALDLATRVVSDVDLARRCRMLATDLARSGVGRLCPSRGEMAADQIGRNDAPDRLMVSLARLVFDLALPTETAGPRRLMAPDREEAWVRRLFEKAVLGFARAEMEPVGWSVRGGAALEWQVSAGSERVADILPRMITDIILDAPNAGMRLVIDTKFTSILAHGRFGNATLKSGYLYQMYSYLRSQEGQESRWDAAAGLFLHPAIEASFREHAKIQNHTISFATVDLSVPAASIRSELRSIFRSAVDDGRLWSEAQSNYPTHAGQL